MAFRNGFRGRRRHGFGAGLRPKGRLLPLASVMALVASLLTLSAVAGIPTVSAAGAPLSCDQNTLYGIDSTGQVDSINATTGITSTVKSMSPATNALGVSVNGLDAYAFSGATDQLTHFNTATGTVTTLNNADPDAPAGVIRGAVNPANGIYYYAGSGSTSYLGAYDTNTNTEIGQIGTITGLTSGNGDLAFSTRGLMFVVAGNTVVRVNNTTIPTTKGTASLSTSLVATLPAGTDSPGIAFSTDGYLYVSDGAAILKIDPASGATLATTPLGAGFDPIDLATCNYPNTVSVNTNVVDRVKSTDQFGLSVTGGGIQSGNGNTATTTGTANGLQSAVAGAALAIPARNYTFAETAAGTTVLANYVITYSCVNVNNNAVIATGSGASATFSFPAATSAAGTDVVCTFTNTPTTATLAMTKSLGRPRNASTDQFTVVIRSTSTTGAVQNATTNSTTTGSGSTVTGGTGVTGTTSVVANRTYYFTEAMAGGSSSALAQYAGTVSCTDANNLQTGLPTGAAFNGSLSLTPVSGAAITCALSNSTVAPKITVSAALGGPRVATGDQFTVAVRTGSATGPVVNSTTNSTTAGTGATVTTGTGTTGAYVGAVGTDYYLTESASANGAKYNSTISCTDANGFQTGLPSGAAFSGSLTITPVAGAAITCVVTNTRAPATLSLVKTNPATLSVGATSAYSLVVSNGGGTASTGARVLDKLPANVQYVSATAPGWTCSASGTAVSGQTVTCTGGAIAAGATSTLVINVTPLPAAAGLSVQNRASVDPTGGTSPASPTTCTATGTPAGCAVPPAQTVGNGIDLSLTKTNPAALTVGAAASYSLTVTNSGSAPAASATVTDVLPANLTYNSATGATCTAAGQVLTCTVPGPIAAGGGTKTFTVVATPTVASLGTSVRNKAAVDPTGGTAPVDPTTCTVTGTPTGCAVPAAQTVGAGVNMSLTKTNPNSLVVGVAADYGFTVTNDGTLPADAATVVDVLPANLTYNSATGATCTAAAQVITCAVPGSIAADGGTKAFTINVTPQGATAGTTVQNKAAVDPTGGSSPVDPTTCTATGVPSGCAVAPFQFVDSGAELSLTKTNPASLTVGVAADYSLTVTNSGTGSSATATVVDVLPDNLTFNAATGAACTASGQALTCTVTGPIAGSGGTKTFTLSVTPQPAASGVTVDNKAAVDPTGGNLPTDPTTCTATGTPSGCAVPPGQIVGSGIDLTLAKTDPAALTVGVPADYTLTVTNTGTGPSDSATVIDALPPNLTYNSATGADCTAVGQVITCTVPGPIAAGGGTAAFTIDVTPTPAAAGTVVGNLAAVDPTGDVAPVDPTTCVTTGDPAGCAVPPTRTIASGIDLTLDKTNPDSLTVGAPADYTLTVTNTGTGPADSATVIDALPLNLTYNSASGADCTAVGQVVTCTVPGPIAAGGGTAAFTIDVIPTAAAAGTVVGNIAAVDPTGGTSPTDPTTCTATGTPAGCAVPLTQTVASGIDLTLDKANPDSLTVGAPADYTLTVTNTGTGPADSATVIDALPLNLTYNSASGADCTAVGQVVTCTVPGPIAAGGGTAAFTIDVTPTPAAANTTTANTAAVDPTGGTTPPDPTTCVATDDPAGCAVPPNQVVGSGIDLTLGKTNPAALTVGVPADYTLTVTNAGTGPADSGTVIDALPLNLTYNSATGADCTAVGQVITCTVPGPIAAGGGTAAFTIDVTPTPAAAGTLVGNLAAVDPTGDVAPVDPTTCVTTGDPVGCAVPPTQTVGSGVDLSLHKTNPAVLTVGVETSYTFAVINTGTGPADSATVTDTLPPNLSYDSAIGADCTAAGQVVTCTIPGPIVENNGSKAFTINVTPTDPAAGENVQNKATVDPTGGDEPPDPTTCSSNGTPAGCAVPPAQSVGSGIELSLVKTNPDALTVGVASGYGMAVTNVGTGPAASATVTDTLPAHLTYTSATGADCTAAGQVVTCTVAGPLAPGGTKRFTVTVTPDSSAGGLEVQNHAAVDPSGGTSPVDPTSCTGNGTPDRAGRSPAETGTTPGCAVPPAQIVGPGIDLTLEKTNPASMTVGVAADYTLTVTNAGTGPAASATVVDALPAGLDYNSAAGADCTAAGQVITCTVAGPIGPGNHKTFTLDVTPTAPAGTSVVNKAAVDTTGGVSPVDPTTCTATGASAGCAVTPALPIGPIGMVQLSLTKTNPASLTVGVPADYTLTITNSGVITASSATVVDQLPAGISYQSATGATCLADGQVVTCTVPGPIIGAGGSATIILTVMPQSSAAGTSVVNRAAVDPTGGPSPVDPITCTATGSPLGCAVAPSQPVHSGIDLTLTKANPAAMTVGVPAQYVLTVTNTGTQTADGATVADALPAGLTYLSATGAECVAEGQLLTCRLTGSIAPDGGRAVFTVTVLPTPSAGAAVVNKAAVNPGGGEPGDPTTCTATGTPTGCAVTPPLQPRTAALHLLKTAHPIAPAVVPVSLGNKIGYSFTVTNASNLVVTDVQVIDNKEGPVHCPTLTLAPGASTICSSAPHTVTQADMDAGEVTNTAVAVAELPKCPAGAQGCQQSVRSPISGTTTPTLSVAGIQAVKTATLLDGNGDGLAEVGETIVYTVRIHNAGTITLRDIDVSDPMLPVSCPETTLVPGAVEDCTGTHVVTVADQAAGHIVNTAVVKAGGPHDQIIVSPVVTAVVTVHPQVAPTTPTTPVGPTTPTAPTAPVAPPVPVTPPVTPTALSYTGVPATEMILSSLLFLLFGTALVLVGRRRRRGPTV